jgi:hypothetical protein
MDSFTIVIPTRDNPASCEQVLDALLLESAGIDLPLRVTFLVNDTGASATSRLEETIGEGRFATLRPRFLRAERNHPTVEENIRHTLGANLDAVDEHFLIIGNSDHVHLGVLRDAAQYLRKHQLDLLLVGVINCEVYEGKTARQFYATPRHLNPKNRLRAGSSYGKDIFSDVMMDYGPVDYLAYIGCQIYSKAFFRAMCAVQAALPEPLYSIPVATLELTTRQQWVVGFFPEVVVTRIDHLQYGENSAQQPPDWWVVRSRTDRGLSGDLLCSVITNSLQLSPEAFATLVNSQMVAMSRGQSQYVFWNFLFVLVKQISHRVRDALSHAPLRYSAGELQDIVAFGHRLSAVDIGLSAPESATICAWLQYFGLIGDYSDPDMIRKLISGLGLVLTLLDSRSGMERWIASLDRGMD